MAKNVNGLKKAEAMSHDDFPYPTVDHFTAAVPVLADRLRGRGGHSRARVGHAGWVVQGYVQYSTFGPSNNPSPEPTILASSDRLTDEQLADHLESLCDRDEEGTQSMRALPPWLVSALMDAIKRFLESR